MGFKRGTEAIGSVLERNRKKQLVENKTQPQAGFKKKEREVTKSYNFTMRPSVREKLNLLVDYDAEFESTSAAGYLSELIESRYHELGLNVK